MLSIIFPLLLIAALSPTDANTAPRPDVLSPSRAIQRHDSAGGLDRADADRPVLLDPSDPPEFIPPFCHWHGDRFVWWSFRGYSDVNGRVLVAVDMRDGRKWVHELGAKRKPAISDGLTECSRTVDSTAMRAGESRKTCIVNGILLTRDGDEWRTPQGFLAHIRDRALDSGELVQDVVIIPPASNAAIRVVYGKPKETPEEPTNGWLLIWQAVGLMFSSLNFKSFFKRN